MQLMRKMGFSLKWIHLISECISTISYFVLVNGEPTEFFKPTRGISQRDPLSPYLFLLCSEGLTQLINHAILAGKLRRYSLCRNGPKISQLFFVDDSLLFCKAQLGDVKTIEEILDKYEKATGQKINKEKTTLFFSKSATLDATNQIKHYLGLPEIRIIRSILAFWRWLEKIRGRA